MNVKEEEMLRDNYREYMGLFEMFLENYFQKPLLLCSFNTYQFDDYDKFLLCPVKVLVQLTVLLGNQATQGIAGRLVNSFHRTELPVVNTMRINAESPP